MSEQFSLAQVYRQVEDHLVLSLRLGMAERVLYYHLLRHSLLEDRPVAQVSKRSLSRGLGCALMTVHRHLGLLEDKGCVRVRERGRLGHAIQVLTPEQILSRKPDAHVAPLALAALDCFRSNSLRASILRRENYACFYCLRHLTPDAAVFDHAVPLAAGGDSSYRNVVACCFHCNSLKRDRPAEEFLRGLFRAGHLSHAELNDRLSALAALCAGHLVPAFATPCALES